jgi:hypothetical protein
MNIQVDFWTLVGLLTSIISVLFGFGKILLHQLDARINNQSERVEKLESQFNDAMNRLPVDYHRRDDAIRFETMLNAKLDAVAALIERLREK